MSFETTLQQVIYSELNSGLPAYNVYDNVPQDAGFPYIVIGEDSTVDWSGDTFNGMQASVTVHTWSRDRGKQETKLMQGLIYDTLHRATLTAAGYNFVTIDVLSSESFLDADGKTRHGVQTFNVIYERV